MALSKSSSLLVFSFGDELEGIFFAFKELDKHLLATWMISHGLIVENITTVNKRKSGLFDYLLRNF